MHAVKSEPYQCAIMPSEERLTWLDISHGQPHLRCWFSGLRPSWPIAGIRSHVAASRIVAPWPRTTAKRLRSLNRDGDFGMAVLSRGASPNSLQTGSFISARPGPRPSFASLLHPEELEPALVLKNSRARDSVNPANIKACARHGTSSQYWVCFLRKEEHPL
jgi:hypothetical protein